MKQWLYSGPGWQPELAIEGAIFGLAEGLGALYLGAKIAVTGARSKRIMTEFDRWFEYAPKAYEEIRGLIDDVSKIAKNVG